MALQTAGTSLEDRTQLVGASVWEVRFYPGAAEAVAIWRPASGPASSGRVSGVEAVPDEEENRSSAARRARGRCRRYFAANCLNRLGTLTYRPPGQHDAVALRGDVALFFRKLRGYIGGPFPYLWTPEWHKSEHGLHVHFGVGRYIYRSWLLASWPHGFVHIKLLGDLPARAGVLGESRAAARYLAKYVGKDYRDTVPGMHSYDVAQGFAPEQVIYRGRTEGEVLARCAEAMGRMPSYIWRSIELGDKWHGPLAVFAQWA